MLGWVVVFSCSLNAYLRIYSFKCAYIYLVLCYAVSDRRSSPLVIHLSFNN